MADQIKTVTDESQYPILFETFFSKADVFLKTKNGDLKIQFLGYHGGDVAFRIPHVKNVPDVNLIFTRRGTNTIYANMKFVERSEDTYVFHPALFQIISEYRKEDRAVVGIQGGGKNVIFINNIMSDFNIKSSLEMNDKRNDKVKEIAIFDLEKQFEKIKILFMHESKNDLRMKMFFADPKPLFIPDLNSEPAEKDRESYDYYINNIYSNDVKLSTRNKFVSEVSVPVMFRNIIPYGYIQVNNSRPMSDGMLTVVRRMAIVIDQLFIKNRVFVPVDAKFLITDISRQGIGFAFKDRRHARHFRKDSFMSIDMMLPTMKKAVMGVVVRNIVFLDNVTIKVGCEIRCMDRISTANYEEFLDHSQPSSQAAPIN